MHAPGHDRRRRSPRRRPTTCCSPTGSALRAPARRASAAHASASRSTSTRSARWATGAEEAAAVTDAEQNRIFLDPVLHGRYPAAARAASAAAAVR